MEHTHDHEYAGGQEQQCTHCSCGCCEDDDKRSVTQIIVRGVITAAAVCFAYLLSVSDVVRLVLFGIAYFAAGYDVVFSALKNIVKGKILDENFLMTVATIGAFIIGEYPEAVAVMVFYQIGEAFQDYAVDKSRKSVTALMAVRPDHACILRDGVEVEIAPENVAVGDTVLVKPGEKIPLDGEVTVGESLVDTSPLTGESVPRLMCVGDGVLGGSINKNGVMQIKVTKLFGESAVSKILSLMESSAARKAKAENFITKFAIIYTPVVVGAAMLLALIPPLVIGFSPSVLKDWIYRALVFLVVSCPCALVISIPLSFFGGIGAASRAGILVKGGNYFEVLAHTGIAVFDKTGTLTRGNFTVSMVHLDKACPVTEQQLIAIAAHAETYSSHPISLSLRDAHLQPFGGVAAECCRNAVLQDVTEIAGQGISAVLNGQKVLAGNALLMTKFGVSGFTENSICAECAHLAGCDGICDANCLHTIENRHPAGTIVHAAIDGVYCGHIIISDEIKSDSPAAVAALKKAGIRSVVMLTGDTETTAKDVAQKTGIDEFHAGLLPDGKVSAVDQLLAGRKKGETLIFAGDGINDAPVLALADAGIAMGGVGSDAAIEAADIVIMSDELSKIPQAVRIARRTMHIVTQNIVLALGVKAAVLALSAFGLTVMGLAVFADVGVAFLATLNAVRVLYSK